MGMDVEAYVWEYTGIYMRVYRCVCAYTSIFSKLCALLAPPDELFHFCFQNRWNGTAWTDTLKLYENCIENNDVQVR